MSRWKQGDTQPPLVIDCFDGTNLPANLSAATTVKIRAYEKGVLKWERTPTSISGGRVTLNLQASDTAAVGTFRLKVYAEWPDGSRQHYPPADQYMTMTVTL